MRNYIIRKYLQWALVPALLLVFIPSIAQKSEGKVTEIIGKILDQSTNAPVSFASVALLTDKGEIIGGSVANQDGSFSIEGTFNEKVFLEVQFIGYASYKTEVPLNSTGKILNLGTIMLSPAVQELDEVVVTAERSSIEQKADRKVINIGKDLATVGTSASDIMINIPAVDIDQDGNLTMRGNENVRILVDGKPTNVSAAQLLQQIPSSSVKSIELITNPSAKFNPEGMSGIVNIVLKKNTQSGLNGNFNAGLSSGIKQRYNGAVGLNYRDGKVNLYGDYSFNAGRTPVRGEVSRSDDQSKEFWKSEGDRETHLYKVGVDFYPDKKNTLSFYSSRNAFDLGVISTTEVQFADRSDEIGQSYISGRNNITTTYNLDFRHDFATDGEMLEVEIDHNSLKGSEETVFDVQTETSAIEYVDELDNNRTNLTINLDYTKPLAKDVKLEIGAETRQQDIQNRYQTTNTNFLDGAFDFRRDIHSVYGNLSRNMKDWFFLVGARLEDYSIVGDFSQEGNVNENETDHIFTVYPSAFITYTPQKNGAKNSYNLSYSRRVDRPGIDQINPIRVWSSFRITNVGNPSLIPQFTNSLEFNYSRNGKKGSLTSGVFYRRINDEITRFAFLDDENPGRILFSYNNYSSNSAYGFEASGSYKPTNWWSFNASFDWYSREIRGVELGEEVAVNNSLYNFKMNHSFKVADQLTLQLISLYRGANTNLQYLTKSYYFVNVGARYSIAGGKGTFSISFNDILKSQRFAFDATRPILQTGAFYRDTRVFVAGFTYNFGGNKYQSIKRKKRDKNEKKGGSFL
ncbi:MAG: TonB-dependent receptor family protein [Bacteroidota bacterium]